MSQLAILLPKTSTRSHLPFLKLPAEIRNMIYLLLLSNEIIHIVRSQPYKSPHDTRYPTNHVFKDTDSHIHQQSSVNRDGPLSISILFACSQVYNEARLLPYKNTFHIRYSALLQFLYARTPEQLRLMNYVELTVPLNSVARDDIVGEGMRRAATMLTSLEYLKLNIILDSRSFSRFIANVKLFEIGAIWIKLLGAWEGHGLKLGQVTLTDLRISEGWRRNFGKLEEQLSARLMASSA